MEYQHIPAKDDDGREQALAANIQEQGKYDLGLKNFPTDLKNAGTASGEWTAPDRDFVNPGEQSPLRDAPDVDLIDLNQRSGGGCPTEGDILMSPWSYLTISILVLSIYSTIFSGIFLGIALAKPRWGQQIGVQGKMSYSTATLLSALFSKTIELSFVTVFVALLGQLLSRRAFAKGSGHVERNSNAKMSVRSWITQPGTLITHWKEVLSRWAFAKGSGHGEGISIAEMSMRSWIMQPGTLITRWRTAKYAAVTLVGGLALVATLAATFYTTAAEALVAPKLRFGPQQDRVLLGTVAASFANAEYLSLNCKTPVSEDQDPVEGGRTCLQVEYAGRSYHDFKTWLANWYETVLLGNNTKTSSLDGRPKPVAMLHDNTTVTGQWISSGKEDITADFAAHGRLVQNVTMAMPHANVFNAVVNPANRILQPEDLQGQGEYEIRASTPAPALNVLCVSLNATELSPLDATARGPRPFSPQTVVDELFGFGNGTSREPAPQFPIIPVEYNTMPNVSEPWGTSAVYLLATPPPSIWTEHYVLCSLRATQYPSCTTKYHATQSGGHLSVHCDDHSDNTMSYIRSNPSATPGIIERNWKDVGSEWIRSTGLNQGVSDANASIARLVTQMVPINDNQIPVLNPNLPSIAEALAVLAGCTLVMSSAHAPFVPFYNYSFKILKSPQTQYFNASLRYKDYASGANDDWQDMFYVILFLVFAINVFSLIYLIKQVCWNGQVTDYTEPENLFAIANLSPPSHILQGACGGGPRGGMLGKKWRVDMKNPDDTQSITHGMRRHPHFYVKCVEDDLGSPEVSGKERKRRSRPKSIGQWYMMDQAESPAIEQYRRLTG